MREVEICLINIHLFVSVVLSFTILLLSEISSSSSFASSFFSFSYSSSSSYPLLLANRSTFSSVLVVLSVAARFLLFSHGEMERRNGAVQQSPLQFVRPTEGSSLFRGNIRIIFKYNHIEETRTVFKVIH